MTRHELRLKIEELEKKAVIYSDRDRERFNEILNQIRILELELLDVMSQDYLIK